MWGGMGPPLKLPWARPAPTKRRLDFEPPKQLQVGLGLAGRGCAAGGDRGFVFEAVSLCYVFGAGTQLTVLGESPLSLSLGTRVIFAGTFLSLLS